MRKSLPCLMYSEPEIRLKHFSLTLYSKQLMTKQGQLSSMKCKLSSRKVKLAESESQRQHMLRQEKAAQQEKESLQHHIAHLKRSIPDPNKCRAVVISTVKNRLLARSTVHLLNKDGDPCTGKHVVTGVLRSLANGSVTEVNIVSKSPDTYELSFTVCKSGEHKLTVRVNGRDTRKRFAYNTPDPKRCTAIGSCIHGDTSSLSLRFTWQKEMVNHATMPSHSVATVVNSLTNGSTTLAHLVCKSPDMFRLSYTPHRCGEHELIVTINGREIEGSLFKVFVYNVPDLEKCITSGSGTEVAQKHQLTQFEVHLADEDGEPCTDADHSVTAVLKSLTDRSTTAAEVRKFPGIYTTLLTFVEITSSL